MIAGNISCLESQQSQEMWHEYMHTWCSWQDFRDSRWLTGYGYLVANLSSQFVLMRYRLCLQEVKLWNSDDQRESMFSVVLPWSTVANASLTAVSRYQVETQTAEADELVNFVLSVCLCWHWLFKWIFLFSLIEAFDINQTICSWQVVQVLYYACCVLHM